MGRGRIPSQQRATILSFDSPMSSAGGVWGQPVLGRAADAWGYAPSYAMSAGIAALGLPLLALSRRRTVRAEGLGTGAVPTPQPTWRSPGRSAVRAAA
jgi:MFS family permease